MRLQLCQSLNPLVLSTEEEKDLTVDSKILNIIVK